MRSVRYDTNGLSKGQLGSSSGGEGEMRAGTDSNSRMQCEGLGGDFRVIRTGARGLRDRIQERQGRAGRSVASFGLKRWPGCGSVRRRGEGEDCVGGRVAGDRCRRIGDVEVGIPGCREEAAGKKKGPGLSVHAGPRAASYHFRPARGSDADPDDSSGASWGLHHHGAENKLGSRESVVFWKFTRRRKSPLLMHRGGLVLTQQPFIESPSAAHSN